MIVGGLIGGIIGAGIAVAIVLLAGITDPGASVLIGLVSGSLGAAIGTRALT